MQAKNRNGNAALILMYHNVLEPGHCLNPPDPVYDLSRAMFQEQMQYLHEKEFNVLSLDQLISCQKKEGDFPEKSIVITFDDGFSSHLETALPILDRYHFRGEFFVTVNQIGKPGYLTWEGVKQLDQSGMGIGSHSVNHLFLNEMDVSAIAFELQTSKQVLEAHLGKPISFFAPPGGRVTPDVIPLAIKAGYAGICNSQVGENTKGMDPFAMRRFAITQSISMERFAALVNKDPFVLWQYYAKTSLLSFAKKVLGNRFYQQVRERFLPK